MAPVLFFLSAPVLRDGSERGAVKDRSLGRLGPRRGAAGARGRRGDPRLSARKGAPVYDPFCGGGSIPLEVQRLGLRAYGSDLSPVAVLISKALVEIPSYSSAPTWSRRQTRSLPIIRGRRSLTVEGPPPDPSCYQGSRRTGQIAARRPLSPGCGRVQCARPTRAPKARWCRWCRPSCCQPRRGRRPGPCR